MRGAAPRPAALRPLRLSLLVFLPPLVLRCLAQQWTNPLLPDFDQLAAEPPLNFGLTGQEVVKGIEQVISGKLVIQAAIQVEQMALIRTLAASALMRICENRSNPVIIDAKQDIASFGSPRPEFLMEWSMLPPIGGGFYCMGTISEYGYGAEEEPFDPVVGPPPFRTALAMEFRKYPPTFSWSLQSWRILLGNHTCTYKNTLSPAVRTVTEWTTTSPPGGTLEPLLACKDGDPLMPEWTPPDKKADPEDIAACTYATSPCGCAAMRRNCTWSLGPDGIGYSCQPAAPGDTVSCADCPVQAKCPLDEAAVCASILLPCACAETSGDCRWDLWSTTCIPRQDGGASTTCQACSAQSFCSKPEVVTFDPAPSDKIFPLMGSKEKLGSFINVSFDREMALYASAKQSALMYCRSIWEERYTVYEVDRSLVRMSNGTNLQVDVSKLLMNEVRECDLVVLGDLLRDNDFVFFSGIELGTITVLIPDTIPPTFASFDPPNSMVGITIETTITLYFNEPVRIGRNGSKVSVTALGGAWQGGHTGGADTLVGYIELDGELTIFNPEARSVTLNTAGLLKKGVLYSIAISPGDLTDKAGNPYAGMPLGIYAFRTALGQNVAEVAPVLVLPTAESIESDWDTLDFWKAHVQWVVLALVCLGGAIVIVTLSCRAYFRYRVLKSELCSWGPPQPTDNFVPEALTGNDVSGGKSMVEHRAPRGPPTLTAPTMMTYRSGCASPVAMSQTWPWPSPMSQTWPSPEASPVGRNRMLPMSAAARGGASPVVAWGAPPTLLVKDCEGSADTGTAAAENDVADYGAAPTLARPPQAAEAVHEGGQCSLGSRGRIAPAPLTISEEGQYIVNASPDSASIVALPGFAHRSHSPAFVQPLSPSLGDGPAPSPQGTSQTSFAQCRLAGSPASPTARGRLRATASAGPGGGSITARAAMVGGMTPSGRRRDNALW